MSRLRAVNGDIQAEVQQLKGIIESQAEGAPPTSQAASVQPLTQPEPRWGLGGVVALFAVLVPSLFRPDQCWNSLRMVS